MDGYRKTAAVKKTLEAPEAFALESLPEMPMNFIEPMLSEPVAELPDNRERWSFEIKLDGYRCLALRDKTGVKLYSRRKNLLNSRFLSIAKDLQKMKPGTILDGEIVALDKNGRPSFNLLQNFRFSTKQIYFYAFDVLAYENKSTMGLKLEQRRELLAQATASLADHIRILQSFDCSPRDMVAAAKELFLEGIIAKRKGSVYQPGKRTRAWLKYKINQSQPFVIACFTPGDPFDALIVGYYENDALLYVAKVRNGFVPRVRRDIAKAWVGLESETCPFANLPEKKRTQWALTREEIKSCVWLKPELVAQVEFVEWTPDDHLRAARFVGLREDKDPRQVLRNNSLVNEQ